MTDRNEHGAEAAIAGVCFALCLLLLALAALTNR